VFVGVEALEADVALGVLIIDELNAVGHKAGPKCLDLLRGVHIESEWGKPGVCSES
jgi:hypothetical protein